ncbi:Alpha/Beta hydrolase protein [Fusarium avenaceum]|nr:Alpha/Beta hydrolase protein [Fusarium avenaceum]
MGASSSRSAMSADNSTGASVAAYELSSALSQSFSEINLQGNLSQQFKQLLQRLDQEASKYTNSQVNDQKSTEWNPSKSELDLVGFAWDCAHNTYQTKPRKASQPPIESAHEPQMRFQNTSPSIEGNYDKDLYTVREEEVRQDCFAGTVKAITATVIERTGSDDINELMPVLVISIRGSASKMDHIVNANSDPKNAGSYIHGTSDIEAHSGFLNSALALDSAVATMTDTYSPKFEVRNGQKPHVVFTGHSSGGAVAQLLYLHHISHPDLNESARFSCVTFGAPPCLSSHVDHSLYQPSEKTICVNIINEFDVVTRADKPYILSLVDIVRSTLDLPPKNQVSESATDEETIYAALKATDTNESRLSYQFEGLDIDQSKFWRLPQSLYHHVGPRVVLLMRLVEGEMSLKAVEVTPFEFQKLLFCRVAVHGKRIYAERVEKLQQGRFNGRLGWEQDGDGEEKASLLSSSSTVY